MPMGQLQEKTDDQTQTSWRGRNNGGVYRDTGARTTHGRGAGHVRILSSQRRSRYRNDAAGAGRNGVRAVS